MTCTRVTLPSGGTAIVCTTGARQARCACGRAAPFLCDWKVKDRRSGTCDAPLCEACRHSPAPEKDLCPQHADEWRARLERQAHA